MANVKITELTAATALASTDVLPIVDVGADATKKVSVSDLLRNLPDGSAANPSLAFADDQNTGVLSPGNNSLAFATSGTQRLVINSSGKVGIGLASPSDLLEIKPTSTREGLTIKTTGTTFGGINIDTNRTGAGHTLGDIRFMWNGTGVAGITGHTGSDTTNKDDGRLIFNTASAGSATERMRIDSSGKVGIGQSSPNALLEVNSGTAGNEVQRIEGNYSSSGSVVLSNWRRAGGAVAGAFKYNDATTSMSFGTTTSHSLMIRTGDSDRLTINSSGNVGIGNTSPASGLDIRPGVTGAINAITMGYGRSANPTDAIHKIRWASDDLVIEADSANTIASNIQFRNDGTEYMRIDSSGKLLIGSSTGSIHGNRLLQIGKTDRAETYVSIVSSTSSESGILFADTTTNDNGGYRGQIRYHHSDDSMNFRTAATERMRIDSSGRLLVGTTSNTAPGGFNAKIQTASTSFDGSISLRRDSNNTGAQSLVFGKSRGSLNGNTIVQSGDTLGTIDFYGADGTDLNNQAAQILAAVDGTPGTNDMPGRLVFSTSADGANVPTERMRIDSSGVVQSYKYHRWMRSDGTTNCGFVGRGDQVISGGSNADLGISTGGGDLVFGSGGTSEKMRIDSAGVVKINQAAAHTLRVQNSTSGGANMLFQNSTTGTNVGNGLFVGIGDNEASYIWNYHNEPQIFGVNNTERMRLTGTSRLGVGVSSPAATLHLSDANHGIAAGYVGGTLPNSAGIYTSSDSAHGQTYGSLIVQSRAEYSGYGISFRSSNTERMRIASNGYFKVSNNGSYVNTSGSHHEFSQSATGQVGIYVRASSTAFANDMLFLSCARSANSNFYFLVCRNSGTANNAFLLRGDGNAYADGSWNGGGADYAEYFEWSDGNTEAEDRRGISVVLDGDKIREAVAGEEPIGVISGNPSVVGDGDVNQWKNKHLRDDYGSFVLDENGDRQVNPDYNPDTAYIRREDRPEWDTVGLMGKLRIRKGQVTGTRWIKMRDVSDTVEEWLVR